MALGKLKRRHRRKQREMFSQLSGVDVSIKPSVTEDRVKTRHRISKPGKGSIRRAHEKREARMKAFQSLRKTGTLFGMRK